MNYSDQSLPFTERLKRLLPPEVRRRLGGLKREPRRILNRWRGREIVHILHIGKTGGTALQHALKTTLCTQHYLIELHGHNSTLMDIPEGDRVVFFVRDPIKRFISGFYSRKRQGQPRHNNPWRAGEEAAFGQFTTPNELGVALSSGNKEKRNSAINAMKNIGHVKTSYWDWFGNEGYFLSRTSDFLFIGFQENLSEDFEILKDRLKLPETVKLPEDEVEAHKNPQGLDTHLEEAAIRNLKEWYASDYDFVTLCRQKAKEIESTYQATKARTQPR